MSAIRFLYSFFLVPFLLISQEQRCSTKAASEPALHEFAVTGTITQTHSYCGGARPPDELLAKLQSPRPFAGKKIYFRKGDKNLPDMKYLKSAISDSAGHFKVLLPAGTWCIIEEDQVKPLDIGEFKKKYSTQYLVVTDETCLKEWWGKCLMTFDVGKEDKSNLTINFHIPCFTQGVPCMKYTGPMPQ